MDLRIHIDGGARGNPGPSGAGVVIHTAEGVPVLEAGYYLGRLTNNQAEYTALLNGLKAAARVGGRRLEIISDSELMVRQVSGEYRVKNEGLKKLYLEASELLKSFEKWRVRHVRREDNARADELANLAMDAGEDVIEVDAGAATSSTKARQSPPNRAAPIKTMQVIVSCTQSPDVEACPAPCNAGTKYPFTAVTPAGICIHAATAVIEAVVDAHCGEAQVTCPREGCGATFRVMTEA